MTNFYDFHTLTKIYIQSIKSNIFTKNPIFQPQPRLKKPTAANFYTLTKIYIQSIKSNIFIKNLTQQSLLGYPPSQE